MSKQRIAKDEDTEIFEITDFTTATDFERFVARLEELVHEWKLTTTIKGGPVSFADPVKYGEETEEISFAGFPFLVTHHYVIDNSQTSETPNDPDVAPDQTSDKTDGDKNASPVHQALLSTHDFPDNVHCLSRWFGVQDFLVISPQSYHLTNESRINTVLSAINNSILNSECQVPIFMLALETWRKFYLGRYLYGSLETSFEMVHLRSVPPRHQNLSGLTRILRSKMNIPGDEKPQITVSIRFTYVLQDWEEYMFDWPQAPPALSGHHESAAIGFTSIDRLPFGACRDPVSNFLLFSTWPNVAEDMLTEDELYTDLDPLQAPKWSVRVNFEPNPGCLLADCLVQFVELCNRRGRFETFTNKYDEDAGKEPMASALNRIAEPQVQRLQAVKLVSKVTNTVSNSARLRLSNLEDENMPIPVEVLNSILLYIFPDADDTTSDTAKAESSEHEETPEIDKLQDVGLYKSAPRDSPIYKLAVTCCIVNYAFGGLQAVSHLWHEFVLEMRYRLENSIFIPGVEKGSPNLGQGLLYQKIQMLNCCIERKKAREDRERNSPRSEVKPQEVTRAAQKVATKMSSASSQASDSDDEFYECDSEVEDKAETTALEESPQPQESEPDPLPEPEGRIAQLRDLTLLHIEEPLYLPVTQETAPMTEDVLEQHAEVLTKLGTSEEGAALRAKMQSSNLLSDMSAFKAANPGCCMDDFVRWYSPRDYDTELVIDPDTGETVEEGSLSDRMLVPGNIWQEAWKTSQSIPAHRQKRLFDDTKEAEKVLHFLSSLTPSKTILYLLPIVCQEALLLIDNEGKDDSITKAVQSMQEHLQRKTREYTQSPQLYSDLISHIKSLELAIAKSRSLQLKFACDGDGVNHQQADVKSFLADLLTNEVNVIGGSRGPVGRTLIKMFEDAQRLADDNSDPGKDRETDSSKSPFPEPSAREYILKCLANRPAPYSIATPQRMYCTLKNNEYRIAGAFSSDTTFT